MQQQLINLNPDLNSLGEDGYELEVVGAYLLAHHIPYVNKAKQVQYGTLISLLTLTGPNKVGPPADHTIYFRGETPCDANGAPLTAIINNSARHQLTPAIVADHYFSSKPKAGNYANYYDKIRTYAEILVTQARVIDPSVTPRPNKKQKRA